jgi:hypothetical protein
MLEVSAGRPKADLGLGPVKEPVCESGRTLKFLVQRSVAFRRQAGEHEKECLFLSLRPVPAAEGELNADTIFARLRD